jgi:hypothetical protein
MSGTKNLMRVCALTCDGRARDPRRCHTLRMADEWCREGYVAGREWERAAVRACSIRRERRLRYALASRESEGSLVGEMSTHAKFMPATVIQRGGFLDGSNREGARVSARASAHAHGSWQMGPRFELCPYLPPTYGTRSRSTNRSLIREHLILYGRSSDRKNLPRHPTRYSH